MWAFPLTCWIVIAALYGAAYGGIGHDPDFYAKRQGWLIHSAVFFAAWALVATLLSPVIFRINLGRWDWRRARTESIRVCIGAAQLVALLLGGAGVYELAVTVSKGWPGGWRDAAVGALIGALTGAVLGFPANLLAARFRIANWLGPSNQRSEHDAGADSRRA
jgi:hypothetical protein